MSGYLIRVGLDTGDIGGGGHAPIDYDGTFDYIPIPEDIATREETTYKTLESRIGASIEEYPDRPADAKLHRDPEFDTYTYGEVGPSKRNSLRKLSEGDLLIFYSSLQPRYSQASVRLYIIGYFTVESTHDLEELDPEERANVLDEHSNNAHTKRESLTPTSRADDREKFPIIVSGDPEKSRLLDRAIPLTSPTVSGLTSWYHKYRPLSTPDDILGLRATDLTRSLPKKLRRDPDAIRSWLEGDTAREVALVAGTPDHYLPSGKQSGSGRKSDSTRTRGYVLKSDTGFAPHVRHGLISLATCAPQIRSSAEPGEWVFAVGSRHYPTRRELVYAFRVEYTIHMDEYYNDDRFHGRKPILGNDNPPGDNIYAPRDRVDQITAVDGSALPERACSDAGNTYEKGEVDGVLCYTHQDGNYFQLDPGYHDLSNYKTDLEKQGDREKLLISSGFYYFGENTVTVPEDIAELVVPGFGDHGSRNANRKETNVETVTPFVEWLRSNFRVGVHGQPKHFDDEIELGETTGPGC